MCGYIGSISTKQINKKILLDQNERIICRGPDQTRIEHFKTKNLYFDVIFNRLSILDLSDKASQPMYSSDKSHMLIFNGEIFNYKELREMLSDSGIEFKSDNSDTEVLLQGLISEGIDFIKKIIGQFSIIFCDLINEEIYMIRDRTGQKPLFYSFSEDSLFFSSNLKSIANLSKNKSINLDSVSEFLTLGVVTSPNTIFDNIYKLEPGNYLKFSYSKKFNISQNSYWKICDHISNNEIYSQDYLYKLVEESIKIRLRSDVPIATFCSGGLDSTLLIKIIKDNELEYPTFSVLNKNPKYDERDFIKMVTLKYKTSHNAYEIGNQFGIEDLIQNLEVFDEPYADASNFPSTLISNSIAKNYKVAISGDGGDEIFFGYVRFQNEMSLKKISSIFINFLFMIYPSFLGTGNSFMRYSKNYFKSYGSYFEDKKLIKFLYSKKYTNFENKFMTYSKDKVKNLLAFENQFFLSEMMNLKVDRTSMYNSLEVRSPFVDHRLIEYLLSCKTETLPYKIQKKFVKEILNSDFPIEFLERKKMGFVFDLENIIFKNKNFIIQQFKSGNLENYISIKKVNLLFLFKTRINAIRIYKLLVLNHFLIFSKN